MKYITKLILILSLEVLSLYSISFATLKEGAHYHPVMEIETDALPESIMDIKFIHTISKLPIVFRGAAKHWEAMNWTPEFLEAEGFTGITEAMESESGKRVIARASYNMEQLLKDLHYFEIRSKDIKQEDMKLLNQYDPEILDWIGVYHYEILAGSKGFNMNHFHHHPGALLAEFYGQRVVYLGQPQTSSKEMSSENKYTDDFFTKSTLAEQNDPLFKIKNINYHPFQKVVLNPGDILYIPANWWHKVIYATPCIGATQFVYINR